MATFPGAVPSYAGFTSSHTLAADNHASQSNSEQGDISAIATKIGTGASTPISGVLLRGNGVGTSAWAQVGLTTDVTGVLPIANGGTGASTTVGTAASLAVEVGKILFPVGCIYIETTGVNPSTGLGFGTWVAFAQGQTLIGVGTSDQAFAAGATGGESSHVLSSNEMPSHTHTQDAHSHVENMSTGANNGVSTLAQTINQSTVSTASTYSTATTVATNQNTGGGATHNNLPPYLVTYFWRRTA